MEGAWSVKINAMLLTCMSLLGNAVSIGLHRVNQHLQITHTCLAGLCFLLEQILRSQVSILMYQFQMILPFWLRTDLVHHHLFTYKHRQGGIPLRTCFFKVRFTASIQSLLPSVEPFLGWAFRAAHTDYRKWLILHNPTHHTNQNTEPHRAVSASP
jgi:hypothetical protein